MTFRQTLSTILLSTITSLSNAGNTNDFYALRARTFENKANSHLVIVKSLVKAIDALETPEENLERDISLILEKEANFYLTMAESYSLAQTNLFHAENFRLHAKDKKRFNQLYKQRQECYTLQRKALMEAVSKYEAAAIEEETTKGNHEKAKELRDKTLSILESIPPVK